MTFLILIIAAIWARYKRCWPMQWEPQTQIQWQFLCVFICKCPRLYQKCTKTSDTHKSTSLSERILFFYLLCHFRTSVVMATHYFLAFIDLSNICLMESICARPLGMLFYVSRHQNECQIRLCSRYMSQKFQFFPIRSIFTLFKELF